MIIPVRCFTCGAVIGDKYQEYMALIHEAGNTEEEAMNALGLPVAAGNVEVLAPPFAPLQTPNNGGGRY